MSTAGLQPKRRGIREQTLQCCTFAGGRVVTLPLRLENNIQLPGADVDIRIDRQKQQIYYDGLTGGYGNDQLQYIAHIGHQGFVIDQIFGSRLIFSGGTEPFIMTTHNFKIFEDDDPMDSIFSPEEFQKKDPLNWLETRSLSDFIKTPE